MCLLAILWRVVDDAPLIVAANREEAYSRGGTPPQVNGDGVRFIAGVDPTAGGTWLGVNQYGVIVAVTNQRRAQPPKNARSRGLLVRDLLQRRSAKQAAADAILELEKKRYAGCNLFFADRNDATVLHASDWLRHRTLSPGVHVLTSGELNDARDARAIFALDWLASQSFRSANEWIPLLETLCSHAGDESTPPICLRATLGGTVSSSIIVLREPLKQSGYWHCQGPPDEHPYREYSNLFSGMA